VNYTTTVNILGAFPRIGILFKIEKFKKNKHSHMFDIASIIFLGIPKSLGKSAFSDSLLAKYTQKKTGKYTQVTMLFLQFISRFTMISNGKI